MRKVMIDCKQNIPCNPCKFSCPVGAIEMEHITDEPKINHELCTGCGVCVAACPGQACFIVDETYSKGYGSIDFPYEYLPLPEEGSEVEVTDNEGHVLTTATVVKVREMERFNKTRLVTVTVPDSLVREVRGMRPIRR